MDSNSALSWAIGTVLNGTRRSEIVKLFDYYEGLPPEMQLSTNRFRQAFGNMLKTFNYNRCETVIDTFTDRLFLETFDCGDDTATADLLEEVFGINRMDAAQLEVHASTEISGNGYVVVWPEENNPRYVTEAGTAIPRIIPQRSEECAFLYYDDDPSTIEVAAKGWQQRDRYIRVTLYFEDRIERYITQEPFASRSQDWTTLKPENFRAFTDADGGDSETGWIPNPYGYVPMVPFINNPMTGDPEGQSELWKVIPLQQAINKSLADMIIAEEFGAYPLKVLIGVDDSEDQSFLSTALGADMQKSDTAKAIEKFESGVDRVLTLMNANAKIGEFTAINLDQFVKVSDHWDVLISRATKIPVHYLSMTGSFPSGRALRTADTPLVFKSEKKQISRGNSWEDVARISLVQMGLDGTGKISAKWRSAAPMSKEDDMDYVQQQINVGIPLEIALADVGYSAEEIEEITKINDEKALKEQEMFAAGVGMAAEAEAPFQKDTGVSG